MRSNKVKIRLLLPCTIYRDQEAIKVAVKFAHSCGAILILLLLRPIVEDEKREEAEVRLHQSDFLEMIQNQAMMKVPIEWFQIPTHDVGRTIHVFAEEMYCTGIFLFVRQEKGVLLETNEVHSVIKQKKSIQCFLFHLPHTKKWSFLLSWLQRYVQKKKNGASLKEAKRFPKWYPYVLLTLSLSVITLIFLNAVSLLAESPFSLVSLIIKVIFIFFMILSLFAMLNFFVEKW